MTRGRRGEERIWKGGQQEGIYRGGKGGNGVRACWSCRHLHKVTRRDCVNTNRGENVGMKKGK